MIGRSLVTVFMVLTVMVGSATAAMANELTDRLSDSVGVAYSGEQSVVCNQPDGRHSELFDVGQNDLGITVTVDPAGTTRAAAAGALSTGLGSQYEIGLSADGEVLGRRVEVIEVFDGDTLRVRLSFDVESSVLLMSEIFNSDGSPYCTTRFIEFHLGSPGPARGVTTVDSPEPAGAVQADDVDRALPLQLAGFSRLQVRGGSQSDLSSAFYGDGLFTFQLTNSSRPISIPELDDQPRVTIEGHEYQRIFELGRAVYAWHSNLGGYVLVGELPVDVQARVLSELPDPRSRGFFERLWDGLFG